MHEVMTDWTEHKRGGETAGGASSSSGTVLPLGPGEWDEGLGIPLCVVCQGVCLTFTMLNLRAFLTRGQADKIPQLEKENGWREEQFDYVLQFMRTVLLKRMVSLLPNSIY